MTMLTPQDIQSKQFHVRFRGFDVDEVDVFLEKIAEDFLTLIQENKQLREKIDMQSSEIETYREQERAFKQAILSAQNIADEMKSKSRREADDIIAAAKMEALQLRNQANAEVARVEKQLDELKAKKMKIRGELDQLLRAYLARLDEIFEEDAAPSPAPSARKTDDEGARGAMKEPVAPDRERPDDAISGKVASIDDLSDLYEKVDLPEEFSIHRHPDEGMEEPEAEEDYPREGKRRTVPDLDSDIMFKLEDPLDEKEPDIPIFEEKGKK